MRVKPTDYVVLPLYSPRSGEVPVRSGLNQWNAKGRARNSNEVYISIPSHIKREHPDFFPPKEVPFSLSLPNGEILQAKICQDGDKALMSNPNSALGKWILRDVLHLQEKTICTRKHLDLCGIDSLIVAKTSDGRFSLKVSFSIHYIAPKQRTKL